MKLLPAFTLSLASLLPAQFAPVSADFTPDVATPGVPVTFRVHNNSNAAWITGSCDWFRIYPADPATGRPDLTEQIEHALVCDLAIYTIPPGGTLEWTWNQVDLCPGCGTSPFPPQNPAPVPAGRYWFHVHVGGHAEWFSFTIQSATEPGLQEIAPARIGMPASYVVNAAQHPNETFGLFLSLSANDPIGVVPGLGLDLCLAAPLFALGGPGVLDGVGNGLVTWNVPANPALVGEGAHLQAVIVTSQPFGLVGTNGVSVSIRP